MKVVKLRVARPTRDIAALVEFYVEGLGLRDLGAFEGHAGYDGQLFGTDDETWELEVTFQSGAGPCPPPGPDNLVVFYLADRAAVEAVEARLQARGITPVEPANPYWRGRGPTFEDPDGWRVVLFDLSTMG